MSGNPVHRLRTLAFKYRGGVWTVLFVAILATARPVPGRIAAGLPLVLLGQLLRFWGVGCITLYRGEQVKARRLTTWGPYALMRNPLYAANGLLGLGWAWIAGNLAVLIFLVTFFILYNLLIVPHEEAFLEASFGKEYLDYKKKVGAFFPKSAYSFQLKNLRGPYDISILRKSEVHSVIVTLVGTLLIISRLWW